MPKSRRSALKPSRRLASTVSCAGVLQLVGAQLVEEADAAAFLVEVDDHPATRFGDQFHCPPQLHPAVAAQRVEDIAGETLRVHPHQHVALAGDIAVHQRDVFRPVDIVAIADDAEVTDNRGKPRVGDPVHQPLGPQPVGHQLGHRHQRQPVFRGKGAQLRQPRHRAVGVEDLADHAGRLQPRQPRQVDARLGVADPLQHAPRARLQRRNVPRAPEVTGHRVGGDGYLDGPGAVGGRDAGGHAEAALRVDGDRERGGHLFAVAVDHLRQVEARAILRRQRKTDPAAGKPEHEVDDLGRDTFGRADEVTLVLAVLVVDDDDHLPRGQVGNGLRNRRQGHGALPGPMPAARKCRTYLPITSPSRCTASPGARSPSVVCCQGKRNQTHLDSSRPGQALNGQRHAVDGHRAERNRNISHHGRGVDLDQAAVAPIRHRDHPPHPVDVALHEVPAEAVGGPRPRARG